MTKPLKLLVILMAGLFLTAMLCGCASITDEQFTIMEEEIQTIVSDGNLPSIQMAVIENNQLVWSKTVGEGSGPDLVYMNGSVQKVVDATAVLQLYERGLIDLDGDISTHLPFQIRHPG